MHTARDLLADVGLTSQTAVFVFRDGYFIHTFQYISYPSPGNSILVSVLDDMLSVFLNMRCQHDKI